MRFDGRQPNEMRPVRFQPDYTMHAEGSVLVQFGNTWVLVTASVEEDVPPWLRGQGRGWLTATYNMLPRSTHTRHGRETKGESGRTKEIQRLIGRAMRSVVDLSALNECQVVIDCDVLQADGGTRTAAITGGYVALALAMPGMLTRGLVKPGTTLTPVAAVSVGVVNGIPCLDLAYEEDSTASVDCNVVMNGSGQFIEVQGAGEMGGSFSRATLEQLLDLAEHGLTDIFALQQAAIEGVQ